MRTYLVRRFLQIIPVLFLGTIGVFALIHALPGDPATALAGEHASQEQVQALRMDLGLNRSAFVQYGIWFSHALTGNLGHSYISGHSVSELLLDRIPATAQLAVLSMIIGLALALPIGMAGALRPHSLLAKFANGYRSVGLAVPTFWLGLLLIIVFSVQWHVLPSASDYVPIWTHPIEALKYSIMPSLTIGFYISSIIARYVSAALSETMQMDYIRTIRAKGASERRVILRHGLRNALLPIVTVVGLQLGSFLGGTIIVEVVFNYPGLGRLIYSAVSTRDYALIQGAILFVIVGFLMVNLIVDLLYAWLDPRIRLS